MSVALSRLASSGQVDPLPIIGDSHGVRFCRLAVHAWHRAKSFGAVCPLRFVLHDDDGDRINNCDVALMGEPESLIASRISLFDVANIIAPLPYRKLFEKEPS